MQESLFTRRLFRVAGIAGVSAILFIPAMFLQIEVADWFPEKFLQNSQMSQWLSNISAQKAESLGGIGLFIFVLLMFLIVGSLLYSHLKSEKNFVALAFAINLSGAILALSAFGFAFGFTWSLAEMAQNGSYNPGTLEALSTMGMRGFLVCDDLATCLIGISNALFSIAALRAGLLPKWIFIWSVVGAFLVTIVLGRYFVPVLAFGTIGYPMVVLWFVFTGIVLIRRSIITKSAN